MREAHGHCAGMMDVYAINPASIPGGAIHLAAVLLYPNALI